MRPSEQSPRATVNAHEAVADLHHGLFTGLVLGLIGRRSPALAEDFVFRCFRRQHEEKFLPGLAKLGLDRLPHAVAAARYHFQSNAIGGVLTEYVEETPKKAWVRYPPPRWIWAGTAICAVPPEVNTAMLRGWHAQNGVTLGNPRLGFVCTGTTVAGAPGLEGYYVEEDRVLAPDERLRFSTERMPAHDAVKAPKLSTVDWPAERLAKAKRNYAIDYVRTGVPVLIELLGRDDGIGFGRSMARLIGMQLSLDIFRLLGEATDSARVVAALARAGGHKASVEGSSVIQNGWPLEGLGRDAFRVWSGLIEGLVAALDRDAVVEASFGERIVWRFGRS